MSSPVAIKICGLSTAPAVQAAAEADFLGFVLYPRSPRHVEPSHAAALARLSPVPSVAVTVDADDALLAAIFAVFQPEYVQFHGSEPPGRIEDVKRRYGVKAIKAIKVASAGDIAQAHAFEPAADLLLFDAASAEGLPGGNGFAFDAGLLKGHSFARAWFLSGGLNAATVEQALAGSGAPMVDISSGVESAPGMKDPALIRAFINHVRSLSP